MTNELQYIGRLLWHRNPSERAALMADTNPAVFQSEEGRVGFEALRDMCDPDGTINMLHAVEEMVSAFNARQDAAQTIVGASPVGSHTLRRSLEGMRRNAHTAALMVTLSAATTQLESGIDPAEIDAQMAECRMRHGQDFGQIDTRPIADVVSEFDAWSNEVARVHKQGSPLRFGLAGIDTKALLIPSYGLVSARTSHGKTAFAMHLALGLALAGKAPAIFSLEQPARMVIGRLVSLIMGMPLKVAMGIVPLTQEEAELRDHAMVTVRGLHITVLEGRHTADAIAATASRLALRGKCDIVLIDQMSRIDHRQRNKESKEQAWTRSSNRLSELWKEIGVPVVLLAQLNRKLEVDHSVPSLSHIKDCGSLIEDCCWALLVDRPEADDTRFEALEKKREKLASSHQMDDAFSVDARGAIWINCGKDRNSTMGGIWRRKFRFDKTCGRIEDYPDSAFRRE